MSDAGIPNLLDRLERDYGVRILEACGEMRFWNITKSSVADIQDRPDPSQVRARPVLSLKSSAAAAQQNKPTKSAEKSGGRFRDDDAGGNLLAVPIQ